MGTLPKSGVAEVESDARCEQVWHLLTDITRAGEWSHETQRGDWLGGATGPVVGARFRGRNKAGRTRWTRVNEVLEADGPHRLSWRTVPSALYRDSTRWTFELTPTDRGCRITQRFEVLHIHPLLDRIFHAMIPAHRDRSAALAGDLQRLGEAAAREDPHAVT